MRHNKVCSKEGKMCEPNDVYYWGACPVCKGSESLLVCGRCKLIYYCSKIHQKIHWSAHKALCKSICQVLKLSKLESVYCNASMYSSCREWNDIRTNLVLLTELTLGRKLIPFERQMFMFPRVCEVCKIDSPKELKNCNQCMCVSYCSAIHQEEDNDHANKCSLLKLCRELDILNNDKHYLVYINILPELKYNETKNMSETLDKFTFYKDCSSLLERVICSEILSCPYTLLYSLDQAKKLTPLKENITIHVVGASTIECGFIKVWDVLQKWFPQTTFKLVFIGPEIVNQTNYLSMCTSKENKMCIEFYKGYYHDYLATIQNNYADFIFSFNCGFQEYQGSQNDTWEASLSHFFKLSGSYIILTSYTKAEAVKDLDIILSFDNKKSEILLNCVDNPFSSSRPHRDWDELKTSVFFVNNFISMVKVIV